jgi:hypothetical protein
MVIPVRVGVYAVHAACTPVNASRISVFIVAAVTTVPATHVIGVVFRDTRSPYT